MEDKDTFPEMLNQCCYKCIIENFDLFMSAYWAGNVPAKNFKYLQKVYSKELYEELAGTEHFLKYFDFLLNPYLKEIDLTLCHKSSDSTVIAPQLISIGDSITKLILPNCHVTVDVLLELICRLPNIKSLTLCNLHIKDVLQYIGKFCTVLESLTMNSCRGLTDSTIRLLCQESDKSKCKNHTLQHLDFVGNDVPVTGIVFILKHFPNIRTIEHNNVFQAIYRIFSDNIENYSAELFKPFQLKDLRIKYEKQFIGNDFFNICPLLCPHLTYLNISHVLSQTQMDAFVGFTELKEFHFNYISKSIQYSYFLEAQGSTLEVFSICSGNISVELLLKFCPNLKWLDLRNITFEPLNKLKMDSLKLKFQTIRKLFLFEINLAHRDSVNSINFLLSSSPNLQILFLVEIEYFTMDFANSITNHDCMKTLQKLDVSWSDLEYPTILKLLSSAPNLNHFIMEKCNVTREEYSALQKQWPGVKITWERKYDMPRCVIS